MKHQQISASMIIQLLAEKHHKDVFVPECKNGPTWTASHSRIDAWAMKKSWAHPLVIGYEVKVSRSDFFGDTKWRNYLPMCNELYFVTPHGMINKSDVPDGCGWLEVSSGRKRLFARKQAVRHGEEIAPDVFRYIMMHRVTIQRVVESGGVEYWREWLRLKDDDRKVGRMVRQRMGRLIDLERDKRRIENLPRRGDEDERDGHV